MVPSYRLTALAFPPCSSLCSQECSVWVSPQKTFCLLDTLASSPGSPGSVYLGRNLGHNLSSPPSYLEGDHRMPGEAFSHPTALENIGYLYPVSWQPPLSRIGRKSAGWGAMGPGVLVPACPRTERYAARVPVCPLMCVQGSQLLRLCPAPSTSPWTHRSIEPTPLVHGQVPPGEEPLDGHNAHLHRRYLPDACEESDSLSLPPPPTEPGREG